MATLAATAPQLEPGDELIVVRSEGDTYGNESRDRAIRAATGSHLLFIDDDDCHTESALAVVRDRVTASPDRLHVFRMQGGHDGVLWNDPHLGSGNVGTPMVAVPRLPNLPPWAADRSRESDNVWINKVAALFDERPVFHEEVIALVRPAGG